MTFEEIQKEILALDNKGDLSDGYHSYNELYKHRMILFSIICNQNHEVAWKSLLHHDGTMFDGCRDQHSTRTVHLSLSIGILEVI